MKGERNDDPDKIYRLFGISNAAFPNLFGKGKIIAAKPLDTVGTYSRRHDHSFP
ncbi:hypothetical protein [Cyclobacterium salsum]|uniref:hypothetical protein n=1 Tax=Cyclobacterium salsum TaxID=2666329 RepID=UPI001F3C7419|nr:hypothetical protein [Cyclobacterium salsum]